MNSSIELPPLQNPFPHERFPPFQSPRPRELLPSIMANSPPGRSTTLPPFQRPRPRKPSLTKPPLSQTARLPKHERRKSKDHTRRVSNEGRKAFSAEPPNAMSSMGSRWEDLVEAAASANEADSDRDLTPVRPFPEPPSNLTDKDQDPTVTCISQAIFAATIRLRYQPLRHLQSFSSAEHSHAHTPASRRRYRAFPVR